MLQLTQSLSDGTTHVARAPVPMVGPSSILVRTHASVISPGTERMLIEFGRASWVDKARSQPDKVRQVLEKVRSDGIAPTLEAVREKLGAPIPLGYCQAGEIVEVGTRVTGFSPGMRVVTNGPHAEYVRVPPTLASTIPDGVEFETAAFTPLAAIALQGLRLAKPEIGETVVVYGLGLIGLLAVQLARAAGCTVIGIDRSAERCEMARTFGAVPLVAAQGSDPAAAVLDLTGGTGSDIVLLTLASDSDDPVHHAATMSRKRGRVILVGVTGLNLRRDDFFRKEILFQVSCSYGPGRYDPQHEEKGIDYPLPYVRWTEGRNFAAVLSLMADGKLDAAPLITHRFPIASAEEAYRLVTNGSAGLGIVLTYPDGGVATERRSIQLRHSPAATGKGRVGVIGAGNFSSRTLIPAFRNAGASLEVISSPGGLKAASTGERLGFRRATSDAYSVISDSAVDTVVVATRHDSHASWVLEALKAGKHVFVEKPLALDQSDIDEIEQALGAAPVSLCVGFNRRFAPDVLAAKRALATRRGPLAVSITVNAGSIPGDHWTQDAEAGGGRIAGEGCHFIDLARFLAGSSISALDVRVAGDDAGKPVTDVAVLQLSFSDGSLATIQYLANGAKAYPKERVELFFDGNVIRLDNFRRVEAWGGVSVARRWRGGQDKGHAGLVNAFLDAVRSGGPPAIPIHELLESSRWTIHAARLANRGGGSLLERESRQR